MFTPRHAAWLNLIETFFSEVASTVLRGVRVGSVDELNAEPVVFRWTCGAHDAIGV